MSRKLTSVSSKDCGEGKQKRIKQQNFRVGESQDSKITPARVTTNENER